MIYVKTPIKRCKFEFIFANSTIPISIALHLAQLTATIHFLTHPDDVCWLQNERAIPLWECVCCYFLFYFFIKKYTDLWRLDVQPSYEWVKQKRRVSEPKRERVKEGEAERIIPWQDGCGVSSSRKVCLSDGPRYDSFYRCPNDL